MQSNRTKNKIREAIARKGNAIGTFLGISTPSIVEAVSDSGLDYVIIDTEHGTYDISAVSDMIRAADLSGLCPVVRISDPTHQEIQHAVDNGAEGIIVPCLRNLDDFYKIVEQGKFAPIGNRGFIKGRGSRFGIEDWASGSLEAYMENSNEKVLLLPQCETMEALEHIEEIVAIEGIDGIFVGPFDLSISMGIPGQFNHPQFCNAMDRILSACKKAGKICMTFTSTAEEARTYIEQGYDAVANSLDSIIFAQAVKDMVERITK